jgi:hypothetical protein
MLSVLKRAIEELDAEVQLLDTGRRMICDIDGGRIADVSKDMLVQKRVFRERLAGLISELETSAPKRA